MSQAERTKPIWYRAPMLAVRLTLSAAILWLAFACIRGALHVLDGPGPRAADVDIPQSAHPAGDLVAELSGGGWVFADSPWHVQVASLSAADAKIRMDDLSKTTESGARALALGGGRLLLRDGPEGAPVALEYIGPTPGNPAQYIHATAVALGDNRSRTPNLSPTAPGATRIAVRLAADGRAIAELLRVKNVDSAFAAFRDAGWKFAETEERSVAGERTWTAEFGGRRWRILAWSLDGETVLTILEDRNAEDILEGRP